MPKDRRPTPHLKIAEATEAVGETTTHHQKTFLFKFADGIDRFLTYDMMTWAIAMWLEHEPKIIMSDLIHLAWIQEDETDPAFEDKLRRRLWSEIHTHRGLIFKKWDWPDRDGLRYIKDHYHPRSPFQRVWGTWEG